MHDDDDQDGGSTLAADQAAMRTYHQHLDVCAQCEAHPFDQCAVGRSLLVAAVDAIAKAEGRDG